MDHRGGSQHHRRLRRHQRVARLNYVLSIVLGERRCLSLSQISLSLGLSFAVEGGEQCERTEGIWRVVGGRECVRELKTDDSLTGVADGKRMAKGMLKPAEKRSKA